jgi:hypothetical protein
MAFDPIDEELKRAPVIPAPGFNWKSAGIDVVCIVFGVVVTFAALFWLHSV